MSTHTFDFVLYGLAVALALVAYLRDPGLPLIGLKSGGSLLLGILPRLIAAVILTGMLQVLIDPDWIQRGLGSQAGFRGILVGFAAGILTPGGPMVSFPLMAVFYQSGASLAALVTYMTSWSLFGFQRILAWELPFMGTPFVVTRIAASLALPILAGLLVRFFNHD